MKIAITTQGKDLQAKIDPRFGRAENFVIVDSETMEYEGISNDGINVAHGAGTQAAMLMSEKDVDVVITGNVGPNAHQTLTAAGIKMYQASDVTVGEAIEKFKRGELKEITQAGPAGH